MRLSMVVNALVAALENLSKVSGQESWRGKAEESGEESGSSRWKAMKREP